MGACPGNTGYCYFQVSANGFSNSTPCTPSAGGLCNTGLIFANGTPCAVAVPVGPSPASGVCNNGHQIPANQTLYLDKNNVLQDDGNYGPGEALYAAIPGTLLVNGEGDFAFLNFGVTPGEEFLFTDLTSRTSATPEPSSFALLGTGLAAANFLRRRGRPQK